MATATTPRPRHPEPASVVGAGMLDDGTECYLVPSGSEPGSTHLVRLVGPDGAYRCDCRAAQYNPDQRCRHVDAAIAQDLAELLQAHARHAQFAAYRLEVLDNYPAPGWN